MNEESLFNLALERPAHERSAFLDSACDGNVELRQRVERLLKAHDNPGSFLQEPLLIPNCVNTSEETQALEPGAAILMGGEKTQTEQSQSLNEDLAFLVPSTRPEAIGQLEYYHILQVIGKGGFGTVVKAFDEKLHRVVAIKVLSPELAASGTARQRFIREARTAAAVTHEHVVTIHAVVEEHRPPYLVMQLIDGMTLQEKLDKVGMLSLREILRIGMQMAAGLAAAHKQGLVHRDIKPANILLENGVERVKITDFGLAKVADDASVTQSGVVAGTPMYMSPEQANGEPLDHRSDLFSLGTVLYVMCTGQPPFRATGTMGVLKRVIEDVPRPIREINPEIPGWLEAIINKLHAKNPADRFQTAKEIAELLGQRLADVQAGRAIERAGSVSEEPAMTAEPVAPATAPGRRGKWAIVNAMLVLALLIAATWWYAPTISRYTRGVGKIVLDADAAEVQHLLLIRDGETVTLVPTEDGVELPPGDHDLEAVLAAGRIVAKYEQMRRPHFNLTSRLSMPGPRGKVRLVRGEEVRIKVTTANAPPPPEKKNPPASSPVAELLDDAVLVMNFEKDTFYEKDGKTYVRDLSGKGHDGLCEEVAFTPDGKAGGGLACREGGQLRLATTLLNRQKEYTLVAWVRINPSEMNRFLYGERPPDEVQKTCFMIEAGRNEDRRIRVSAWNQGKGPPPWKHCGTTTNVFEHGQFFFLAVTLRKGGVDEGDLVLTVGEQTFEFPSQMVDTAGPVAGVLAPRLNGVLDEVAIFRRALSREEVRRLHELGKSGRSLLAAAPPRNPPPPAVVPFNAREAREHQNAWARHLGVEPEITNAIDMKLRLIPPGEFVMGLSREEVDRLMPTVPDYAKDPLKTEAPARHVKIEQPFYLGVREVTVGQFREFIKATGYKTTAETNGKGGQWYNHETKKMEFDPRMIWSHPKLCGADRHPVVMVSSLDARAFCEWLSRQTNQRYFVPDEAQWEYACRAGTAGPMYWGDDPQKAALYEWLAPNSQNQLNKSVGSLLPNPFGLFDMIGNSSEIAMTSDGKGCVQRGHDTSYAQAPRASRRFPQSLDNIWFRTTFRVAMAVDAKASVRTH